MGIGMFGLQGSPPLCPQPRVQRFRDRFAKGRLTLVGWVVEHAPNGCTIPDDFAGSRLLFGGLQTSANLANGAAITSDPFKDLTNDASFFQHNLKVRLSGTFVFGDIAIAVGSATQHAHFPHLCSMPLATPTAL